MVETFSFCNSKVSTRDYNCKLKKEKRKKLINNTLFKINSNEHIWNMMGGVCWAHLTRMLVVCHRKKVFFLFTVPRSTVVVSCPEKAIMQCCDFRRRLMTIAVDIPRPWKHSQPTYSTHTCRDWCTPTYKLFVQPWLSTSCISTGKIY